MNNDVRSILTLQVLSMKQAVMVLHKVACCVFFVMWGYLSTISESFIYKKESYLAWVFW